MVTHNRLKLDSVWTRREYFVTRNRVEMPWIKSRKLDFTHSIPTLIHPLTTLRQMKKALDGKLFNHNNLINKFQ